MARPAGPTRSFPQPLTARRTTVQPGVPRLEPIPFSVFFNLPWTRLHEPVLGEEVLSGVWMQLRVRRVAGQRGPEPGDPALFLITMTYAMTQPEPGSNTSLEGVLAKILKMSRSMDVQQICCAILWGMAQENWRLPIIEYLRSTVQSALERDPSFIEDSPGSGWWRLKRPYTKRPR